MPCNPRICECGSWFPQVSRLCCWRGLSQRRKMLCLALALVVSILLSISTVTFPSGYIYSYASSRWHKISVVSSSYFSESQDDPSVQLNKHLPHTSPNPARAPPHVFLFPSRRTVSQVPVNDRPDCSIGMVETRTEDGQRRCGRLAIWTVERARRFEWCGITMHGQTSKLYGLSSRTRVFVAAVVIPSHCGSRQRQAGNGLTKVRRRGSSTVSYHEKNAGARNLTWCTWQHLERESSSRVGMRLRGLSHDDRRESPRHSNMNRREQRGLTDLQSRTKSRNYRRL